MASAPTKPSAIKKLQLSQLGAQAVQAELMGEDVDFPKFMLYLSSQVRTNLAGRITSASVSRTIEGASTITVEVNDWDRGLLRSGLLSNKLDVTIDGLWFRLTTVDKSGDTLTLTFEDREIAILRTYHKWKIGLRSSITRAEFVYAMIKEVKEFNIPTVIPALHKVQPIEKYNGDLKGRDAVVYKTQGLPSDVNKPSPDDVHHHRETPPKQYLTVKGTKADAGQLNIANIIIKVGNSMGTSRKLRVCAIMTGITETLLRNEPGGPNAHNLKNDEAGDDSAGVFQQRPSWGSYTDRTDVETSARLFYEAASKNEAADANAEYWKLCADTQHPRADLDTAYAKARVEAERFVNASGDVGGDNSAAMAEANAIFSQPNADNAYYFYRGKLVDKSGTPQRKPENTWDCIQRLADEVDWRGFFVSGIFYFISEDDLFKQQPFGLLSEFENGIDSIDFNYDGGKGDGSVTISCRIGRWLAPPGSVVVFEDMGPVNGRWLVNEFSRDLIGDSRNAQIVLKKPRPQLPEPLTSNKQGILNTWVTNAVVPGASVPTTSDLIDQIFQNSLITFSNSLETSDVKFGQIYDPVLEFMMWLTQQGYPITVTALKSDHNTNTTEGRVSAHSVGKAVDMGNYNESNPETSVVMKLIAANQGQLGFDQLIGPFPLLCLPEGIYDAPTLAQHKSHIHVGWPV